MIPKIVHYCWFGSDKPGKIRRRIESWKKLLPDYEIWEWNEKNFDVYSIPYTSAAYRAGKYAFVSDAARVHALFHYGGIYLDMDVKYIRTLTVSYLIVVCLDLKRSYM